MIKTKEELINSIEPHIYKNLNKKEYEVHNENPVNLLTYNKLDIAFKLFYLENRYKLPALAKEVYRADICAQTDGKFSEFGNESKNSFEKYIEQFELTFENIKNSNFDSSQSIIPLAKNNSVYNGSHRIASTILLNKNVTVSNLDLPILNGDYKFYYERGVSEEILELGILKFIESCSENIYMAFLWPSGKGRKKEAKSKFSNIVYEKRIHLNFNGAYNLLYELYKHMDWIGSKKNSFSGIQQKSTEAFPVLEPIEVILFQSERLEDVRNIKEEIRKIYNIGFSSVHITDTKEETLRVARLLFNKNGLHFLNFAYQHKYDSIYNELKNFEIFLNENNINKNDVVIDSGAVLALYGIRKNSDLDFITEKKYNDFKEVNIDNHEEDIKYHEEERLELIYNPNFFFYFNGFKFISFNQLYKMKKKRNDPKDKNDCELMEALLSNSKSKKILPFLKQKLLFTKIKVRKFLVNIIKYLGFYDVAKKFRSKYFARKNMKNR